MRQAIYDPSTFKKYIIADYVNKEHASHLDRQHEIIDWFKVLSLTHGLIGELYILRIFLTQSKTYKVVREKVYENCGVAIYVCNVTYWKELDKEDVRFHVYQKVGRKLFGAISRDNLWKPSG